MTWTPYPTGRITETSRPRHGLAYTAPVHIEDVQVRISMADGTVVIHQLTRPREMTVTVDTESDELTGFDTWGLARSSPVFSPCIARTAFVLDEPQAMTVREIRAPGHQPDHDPTDQTREDHMGQQIIKQPDGRYAVFSSNTDTITVYDATEEEIENYFAKIAARRAREGVREKLEHVKADDPRSAYFQFAMTWQQALDSDREHGGDAHAYFAAKASKRAAKAAKKRRKALARHGYDPDLPPRGITGPPDQVTVGAGGIRMRNRVCFLDGIEIDGHERSDLDPGSSTCIHCGDEGPTP